MPPEGQGTVTRWLGHLKDGDSAAVRILWQRYFAALVRLGRHKLRAAPRTAADEEDVALSAFDSFCRGVERSRFPRLENRDDLWRILVTLTAHKADHRARREQSQKRGGDRVVLASVLDRATDPGAGGVLDSVPDPQPTPEFAAMVAEEFRNRLNRLDEEALRRIALLKLEGYTDEEIAAQIGCARRTVARRLALIRKIWRENEPGGWHIPEPSGD